MNKLFYPKLAAQNIKKNSKTYIPYILTCIFTTAMFFVMQTLSCVKWVDNEALKVLMNFGTATTAIFSAIFLYYTNSFLIKQRKKEFGLYSILGMEKHHISRILFIETAYVFLGTTALGIGVGALFSKLTFLLLLKILKFGGNIDFAFYASSFSITIGVFGLIAVLNLVHNLLSVHLSNPVELLHGTNAGEKEPKAKAITAIIGALSLGAGYTIALVVKSPLSAISLFFVAVILVIIGTFLLFSSGSIWLLKALKKNKKYYYKTKHFTSVSSMMYRMKQNAAGLASICILSTAVLVTVSTTVSLYAGTEDVMRARFPRNISVQSYLTDDQSSVSEIKEEIAAESDKVGVNRTNELYYSSITFSAIQNSTTFMSDKSGPEAYYGSGTGIIVLLPVSEYNRITGKNETLMSDEVLVYTGRGEQLTENVDFAGSKFIVKNQIDEINLLDSYDVYTCNYYYFVVPDMETAENIFNNFEYEVDGSEQIAFNYGFDTDATADAQNSLTKALSDALPNDTVEGAEESRDSMMSLYGGLFFLGITMGLLFSVATVLIIYYKQISEGYDDKKRFEIMQNVGMSKKEVKKSIHSQVLTVFFLPLVTAVIHICFGFKVITKLLAMLNLLNVTLFFWCAVVTIIAFAIIYGLVYALTARTYYKIVEDK